MTYLKIFVPLLLLFFATSLSAQANKTASQIHIPPAGIVKIYLDIPSNRVEILKTKSTRISIETNIRLGLGSLPLLDYLEENGRYELTATVGPQTNSLTLSPRKDQKVLLVKGQECPEVVSYKIHIPEFVEFVQTLDASQGKFVSQ